MTSRLCRLLRPLNRNSWLPVIAWTVAGFGGSRSLGAQQVAVRADPRIELTTIMFRLAEASEYQQCGVPRYAAAIDSAFSRFSTHPSIETAKRIRSEHGIGFDAVPSFALSLGDLPQLAPRVKIDSAGWARVDARWAGPQYAEFVRAVQIFSRDAGFEAFYRAHRSIYDAAAASLRTLVDAQVRPEWFDGFFGPRAGVKFVAIPGTCNGGANYGPHVRLPNGTTENYAIIGVNDTTASGGPRIDSADVSTIVHEFAHSAANSFIDVNYAALQESATTIYQAVASAMARQAYGEPHSMMRESLVRATVVQYRRDRTGAAAAEAEMREQYGRGFLWIRGLDSLLSRYQAQRAAYPTFKLFMPEVVRFFAATAATMPERLRQLERARPHLVQMVPASGSTDVDPGISELVFQFDRPMSGGYSFNNALSGTGISPDFTAHTWNADRTALIFGVRLKPDQPYRFVITGAGFQTPEGVPLAPQTLQFRTAARRP